MLESRWGRRLGPGIAAAAAFLVIASTTVGAPTVVPATGGDRPRPDCRGATTAGSSVDAFGLVPTRPDARRRRPRRSAAGHRPWPRACLESGAGVGVIRERTERWARVVGSDDGRRSSVSIVDTARGCAVAAAVEGQVIRHARSTPDGSSLYEFRVRRSDPADLACGDASPARRRPTASSDRCRPIRRSAGRG